MSLQEQLAEIIDSQEKFKQDLKELKDTIDRHGETLQELNDAYRVSKLFGRVIFWLGSGIASLITAWTWLKDHVRL